MFVGSEFVPCDIVRRQKSLGFRGSDVEVFMPRPAVLVADDDLRFCKLIQNAIIKYKSKVSVLITPDLGIRRLT